MRLIIALAVCVAALGCSNVPSELKPFMDSYNIYYFPEVDGYIFELKDKSQGYYVFKNPGDKKYYYHRELGMYGNVFFFKGPAYPSISAALTGAVVRNQGEVIEWTDNMKASRKVVYESPASPDGLLYAKTSANQPGTKERVDQDKSSTYWSGDFSNTTCNGSLTENVDGLNEEYTFRGELSKQDNSLEGKLSTVEKECKYLLTGNVSEESFVQLKLKNLSTGQEFELAGKLAGEFLECRATGADPGNPVIKLSLKKL